ncbi:hypothetical protein Hte_011663 [Hypoxylon texense]
MPRRRQQSPVELAIIAWFQSSPPPPHHRLAELVTDAPKGWVAYDPMVLLPAGSFEAAAWRRLLSDLSGEQLGALWTRILAEISTRQRGGGEGAPALTHLAVNEGIPAALGGGGGENGEASDGGGPAPDSNILRSPIRLRILHGDFGPTSLLSSSSSGAATPGPDDFERALWVSTRQYHIFQTWAPRWTMFSRGNIKEKNRLLDFHGEYKRGATPWKKNDNVWAVDLYAGIGYFAFSYAKLGMRVLCWELNPWSVEGLRRGAQGNKWSVRIVKEPDELALPMHELIGGGEQIIVFLEDNKYAARRIAELGSLSILHINCGLLPTSEASWKDAWDMAARSESDETWLHLHDNVGEADIGGRKKNIEKYFVDLARENGGQRTARVDHTELVKTFAPKVWHCVFDLHTTRSSTTT